MRIEEDLKLGFKDVLIRPKRSTLKSRSDVELEQTFRSELVRRADYRCKYGHRRHIFYGLCAGFF